jgi:hypothetical protein
MGAPDAEEGDDAPAADVDQVLGEQVRADVRHPALATEEADVGGTGPVAEGVVEPHDVVVGVAARRGQEAHAGVRAPGEAEHVVVEQGVPGLL